MLKNQGFIYLTPSSLANAPLIKIGHYCGATLPPEFEKQHQLLAIWSVSNVSEHVIRLHTLLVRAGLAFTLPQVYQSNLAQMVHFIDSWLEVDRHLESNVDYAFETQNFPLHTHYIVESSLDFYQLGKAWLEMDECFAEIAASAFYRGMLAGQSECQLELARCYQVGLGVEIDYMRARELLSAIPGHKAYPHLLHLAYLEQKTERLEQIKEQFFTRAPLPLPGKASGPFLEALLEMLHISFHAQGNLNLWLSSWELIYPYRDELFAVAASQEPHFFELLKETFQSYRQSA